MPGDIPLVGLLRVLVRHEVEFVMVGGVAAVLNGAPVTTFDLDILHRRTPENVERLVAALVELDAYLRTDSRRIRPTVSPLGGPWRALMATSPGVLGALGTIEANTTRRREPRSKYRRLLR